MQLIDLSGEIFHKCPTLPNHPPAVITDWNTHDTFREAEGVKGADVVVGRTLRDAAVEELLEPVGCRGEVVPYFHKIHWCRTRWIRKYRVAWGGAIIVEPMLTPKMGSGPMNTHKTAVKTGS